MYLNKITPCVVSVPLRTGCHGTRKTIENTVLPASAMSVNVRLPFFPLKVYSGSFTSLSMSKF